MNELNNTPNFKEYRQTKSLILSRLDKITNLHPNMTMVQHIKSILRSKGKTKDPYSWTDKDFLSYIEKYIDELEEDPPRYGYFDVIIDEENYD